MLEKLQATVSFLQPRLRQPPAVGLILGSGLGGLAEAVKSGIRIPYDDIPHFPVSTVAGHVGCLVVGVLEGVDVLIMQGRVHYYEGYPLEEVTYPVRVMQQLGVKILVVTNAAGGLNPGFRPGDMMLITDHLNFLGANPLRGPNPTPPGPRFVDLNEAYDPELRRLALEAARRENMVLQVGIYAAVPGPSYETPAEVRFLRWAGADAVGMSTVPEVIVARHGGLRVLGLSGITNLASGMAAAPMNHAEVLAVANRIQSDLTRLICAVLQDLF